MRAYRGNEVVIIRIILGLRGLADESRVGRDLEASSVVRLGY
jgi:hypothetical protein